MTIKISMLLGIDFGSKRVGLAVAPEGGPAAPLDLIEWGSGTSLPDENALTDKIVSIARQQRADVIVVGMPTAESQSRVAVEGFVHALTDAGGFSVVTEDERMSTKLADRLTGYKGVAKPDAVAAMVILDAYIERSNLVNE